MAFYRRRYSSYRKYGRRPAYRKRATYRKKRVVSKKRMTVKAIVKKEIARQAENKEVQYVDFQRTLVSSPDPTYDTQNVIPLGFVQSGGLVLQQGVLQSQRVGVQVKVKKLTYKGTLVPLPYNATTNPDLLPVQVRMLICYNKVTPTELPTPQADADLVNFNAVDTFWNNDLSDMWAPINTNRYRVLTQRTFKLGFNAATATNQTPSTTFPYVAFGNNDFKANVNFSIDLTKHLPQKVQFDDSLTQNLATSRGLFCIYQYVSATGSTIPAGVAKVGLQYWLDCEYEDM